MNFNLSENVLPRTRSEDDISDYEEAIDNIILNLENENGNEVLDSNEVVTRIGCQSPLPSTKFMKYINKDKDNYSIVSELTEYEDKDEDEDTDNEDEDEINYKIWLIEYDYIQDYEEGYEECYRDDLSEANGNHSYCS
jgi:hypothetical protein